MSKTVPPSIQKIVKFYSSMAIFVFNTLIFIVFLEISLGIILEIYRYYKNNIKAVSPITETHRINAKSQNLVRPSFSEDQNTLIYYETEVSNQYIYAPWVQFHNKDFEGKYVNIKNGIRKTIPNKVQNNGQKIWFFGGSTTFGFNVADKETIPSYFAQKAQKNGLAVEITNYACPYYFSKQETILLCDLLSREDKPDKVIFLDGLNDLIQTQPAYYGYPHWTNQIKQKFGHAEDKESLVSKIFQKSNTIVFLRKFMPQIFPDVRSSWMKDGTPYTNPDGVAESEVDKQIFENYFKNVELVRQICEKNNIEVHFFIQPVPFYNYPNRKNDPICEKNTAPRFEKLYPLFKDSLQNKKDMTFLGDMLQNEKNLPFVDYFHYSPYFNEKIAEKMYETVLR